MLITEININIFIHCDKITQYHFYNYCKKNNLKRELNIIDKYYQNLKNKNYKLPYNIVNSMKHDLDFTIFHQDFINFNSITAYDALLPYDLDKIEFDKIQWSVLIYNRKILNKKFLHLYKEYINWKRFSYIKDIPYDILIEFSDYIIWNNVRLTNPSDDFIQKYKKKICWTNVTFTSLDRYIYYKDMDFDWDYITINNILPEWFIRNLLHKLNWNYIVLYQYESLSESFILDYQNEFDMEKIKFMKNMK